MFLANIDNLRVISIFSFIIGIKHTKCKFKNMEDIQSYSAYKCSSFLIPSITWSGKAATIICMTSTKGTTREEVKMMAKMGSFKNFGGKPEMDNNILRAVDFLTLLICPL